MSCMPRSDFDEIAAFLKGPDDDDRDSDKGGGSPDLLLLLLLAAMFLNRQMPGRDERSVLDDKR